MKQLAVLLLIAGSFDLSGETDPRSYSPSAKEVQDLLRRSPVETALLQSRASTQPRENFEAWLKTQGSKDLKDHADNIKQGLKQSLAQLKRARERGEDSDKVRVLELEVEGIKGRLSAIDRAVHNRTVSESTSPHKQQMQKLHSDVRSLAIGDEITFPKGSLMPAGTYIKGPDGMLRLKPVPKSVRFAPLKSGEVVTQSPTKFESSAPITTRLEDDERFMRVKQALQIESEKPLGWYERMFNPMKRFVRERQLAFVGNGPSGVKQSFKLQKEITYLTRRSGRWDKMTPLERANHFDHEAILNIQHMDIDRKLPGETSVFTRRKR